MIGTPAVPRHIAQELADQGKVPGRYQVLTFQCRACTARVRHCAETGHTTYVAECVGDPQGQHQWKFIGRTTVAGTHLWRGDVPGMPTVGRWELEAGTRIWLGRVPFDVPHDGTFEIGEVQREVEGRKITVLEASPADGGRKGKPFRDRA